MCGCVDGNECGYHRVQRLLKARGYHCPWCAPISVMLEIRA